MRKTSSLENNSTSSIPSFDFADLIQYAPDSKEYPQTKNEKGQLVRGTALVVFMGYKHSLIEWVDGTGNNRQVPKLALVFAVKLQNGSFKNIPVKLPYAVAPASNLELALKALGVVPEYETIVTDEDDELFGTSTKLNRAKLESDLETVKGLAYLVEVENKQNPKSGRYYNDVDITTLKQRLGKDNKPMRLVEADKCNVHDMKINFDD